jgi:hypothetical protein
MMRWPNEADINQVNKITSAAKSKSTVIEPSAEP